MAGLKSPYIMDRSDIYKAWPKEPKDKDHIVIGWAELTMSGSWFADVTTASDNLAKEYGYEIRRLVAEYDPVLQSEQVDTFISQDVDILVINPADIMAVIADVERAVEAGIPVVCSATMLTEEDAPVLTSIASSSWGVGLDAGKYIATQYDSSEKLTAGTILGVLGNPVSESRVNGMLTGILNQRLKDNGFEYTEPESYLIGYNFYQEIVKNGHAFNEEANFEVVSQLVGDWTEEGGMTAAEDMLTSHPEIQLVVAENDWMGLGAQRAIENANRTEDIKVGCCADGVVDAIEQVKDGVMLCTDCNSAFEQGEEVVKFIHDIFNGEVDPNNLPIGTYFPEIAITADNVDQFYDPELAYFKYEPMTFKSIPEYKEAILAEQ